MPFPSNGEGSGSSDERDRTTGTARRNTYNARSDEKRQSSTKGYKGKQKKNSARELSYSVDRVASVIEEVVAKLNSIVNQTDNTRASAVEELLAAGLLQRRSPLYYYACTLLKQKRARDMLAIM